jgi:hypothetical protein
MKQGAAQSPEALVLTAGSPVDSLLPCPFCGSTLLDLEEDPTAGACGDVDVWVRCEDCGTSGPRARIGCRDEESEGAPADEDWRPLLQREAAEAWNDRIGESHIAAAWTLDRADQYSNDSCCKVAVENLVGPLAKSEHIEAHRHGELDDLLPRVSRIRNGSKGSG